MYFDKQENLTKYRDVIFGLVASNRDKNSELMFGINVILKRSKYIKPVEPTIEISFDENELVVNLSGQPSKKIFKFEE